jgi:hypothetical protein
MTSCSYYRKNSKGIKQKLTNKRWALNQRRPPLNLICEYCNKEFTIPGVNKKGFKQQVVKYCSGVCAERIRRFRQLWIPKWLFNYYLDKKLYFWIVSFKQSKHSIFSPNRRSLFRFKNINLHQLFVLWHPRSFLRRKCKWLNKLILIYQKWKYVRYRKNIRRSPDEHFIELRRRHLACVRAWQKRQPKDSNFAIAAKFRTAIAGALTRGVAVKKNSKTQILLGTDFKTARAYMESLFEPGMTWENHGLGEDKWHIDHKKPCREFDLRILKEQLECCYYKNLQPLWQKDNLDKGATY